MLRRRVSAFEHGPSGLLRVRDSGMDKSILITGCSSGIELCAAVALLRRILPAGALDAVARRN